MRILAAFIWKHLWCRWRHSRCYPRCDLPSPEYLKHWHCVKCHPCGEELDKLLK